MLAPLIGILDCFSNVRYRGDVLLTASDRYVISAVDGQYSLRIVNITEEDADKYTAKVSNARGICRCTATLAIKGLSFIFYQLFI
jgi:Immunoglobulin I-set domain